MAAPGSVGRRRQPAHGRFAASARARAVTAAAALVLSLGASSAYGRPPTLEDLLQREDFLRTELAPDGRRLVFEQLGPYASASRYDYYQQNPMFRNHLEVAELSGTGAVHPLAPAEPGVGYQLGPVSPDGKRAAVLRLKADVLELGIANTDGSGVRWLGVTPEWNIVVRTMQWRSPTELIAIGRDFGDNPMYFKEMRPQGAVAARWGAAAVGGTSATVIGSGRFLTARPHPGPRRLLRISALSGAAQVVASGRFSDLELSATGRWVAATEGGEDIPLDPNHAVQGPYGVATHRTRLTLVDLETGEVRHPLPGRDVLDSLLAWSPKTDRLLVYTRADGETWTAGRMTVVDAASGQTTPITAVQARVEHRPEIAYAGWLGDDPLVFGRPPGAARDDWYRVSPQGPVDLTAGLAAPPRAGLAAGRRNLLLEAQGGAWRIDRKGRAQRLPDGFAAPDLPLPNGPYDRTVWMVGQGPLAGARQAAGRRQAVRLAPDGKATVGAPLAAGDRLFAVTPDGGAVVDRTQGARETLTWLAPDGAAHPLVVLNAPLADIEWPRAIPVPHLGPEGQPLSSWLFLPPVGSGTGRTPPLVVYPYPGPSFPNDPSPGLAHGGPIPAPTIPLLAHGYAVLMPSLPNPKTSDGPADHLAERILAIVDTAARQPNLAGRFDPERLGVWGYSFGGYAALTVVGQTDRFRAAIATAPITDLFSMEGTFNTPLRVFPEEGVAVPYQTGWTEDLQGGMRGPPWSDPGKYFRNSPAMHADRIHTPVLLFHGDIDEIPLMQSEEMFSALYRQNKDAMMVTYWGQPHGIGSVGDLRDYYSRALGWLDRHLGNDLRADGAAHPPRPESGSASAAPRPPPLTP